MIDTKKLKRENQNIRELANRLEKNREKTALAWSEGGDYYSFLKGYDYVLDELKWILKNN